MAPGELDKPVRMRDGLPEFLPVAVLLHEGIPGGGGQYKDHEVSGWLVDQLLTPIEVA